MSRLIPIACCLAIAGFGMAASAVEPPAPRPQRAPSWTVGRDIYLKGVLGSGKPLEGTREDGSVVSGADAACVNCHQRSGLGTVEGNLAVPPITSDYLFHAQFDAPGEAPLPYVDRRRANRAPYTAATLARAIRDGVDSEGRALHYLMPRYALGDADLAALNDYLQSLTVKRVPGVTATVLHFATIVTPDADPQKRRGMLDVLEQFFVRKNNFPLKPSPPMLTSARTQYSKSMYMANQQWQLHVWELTGPAETWRAQLEERLAAEPVYAVVSGLGGSNWAPVHEFCEDNGIPCLFPNVEVPVVAEHDFYPMYFSKGVLLEAQLIARSILGADGHTAPVAVEQIYRAGDSGERAAAALARRLEAQGVTVHDLPLGANPGAIAAALRKHARNAVVVLWLRSADLAALGELPPEVPAVYMSGLLGGLEKSPLPAGWRERTTMTYPFDLPERRRVRVDYPLGWFSFRHIPIVAEQVQTDTWLACNLLADVLRRMSDNFARPYLIEQLQELVEHRVITGYYPRLTLASNQRFASKGGYIVHFRDAAGAAVIADGSWIVP